MWVFLYKNEQKRGVKESEPATTVLARENYGKANSGFLLMNLDSKHPYMFEVCDAKGSGKFQNPDKLINMEGEVLLDYAAIRKHPKYSEALQSLGITEDALGYRRFTTKEKTIPDLEAYSLVQNYVFLSDQCPTATQAELSEAAKAFYKEGIVITGDRPSTIEDGRWSHRIAITYVDTLDLNQTGMVPSDNLVIYGFSDSDKNAIHSDSGKKYDDDVYNYVRSLDLRVNVSDYIRSNLYSFPSRVYVKPDSGVVPFTSLSQLAELRKNGLGSLAYTYKIELQGRPVWEALEGLCGKLENLILKLKLSEGPDDTGWLRKRLVDAQKDLNMAKTCKKYIENYIKQNP